MHRRRTPRTARTASSTAPAAAALPVIAAVALAIAATVGFPARAHAAVVVNAPLRPQAPLQHSAGEPHLDTTRSTRASAQYFPWLRPAAGGPVDGSSSGLAVPCATGGATTWAAPPWNWNGAASRWEPEGFPAATGVTVSPRLPIQLEPSTADFAWAWRGGAWRAAATSDMCSVASRPQGVDFRALGGRAIAPRWVTAGSVDVAGLRIAARRLGQYSPFILDRLAASGFSGVFSGVPLSKVEGWEAYAGATCDHVGGDRTCDSLPGWGGGPYDSVGTFVDPSQERVPTRHGEAASLTLHEVGHAVDDALGLPSQGTAFRDGPWTEAQTCVRSDYFRDNANEWFAESIALVYAQRRTYAWARRHCPRSVDWVVSRYGAPRFNDAWHGSAYVATQSGTGSVRVRSLAGGTYRRFAAGTLLPVRPGRPGADVQVKAGGRWWVLPFAHASLSLDPPLTQE